MEIFNAPLIYFFSQNVTTGKIMFIREAAILEMIVIHISLIILAVVILTSANIAVLNLMNKAILNEYNDSGSAERALKRMKNFTYIHYFAVIVPSSILFTLVPIFIILIILPNANISIADERLRLILQLMPTFIYFYLLQALRSLILNKTYATIRKVEYTCADTFLKIFKNISLGLFIISLIVLVTFGLFFYVLPELELTIWIWMGIQILIVAVALILVEIIYPWWNSRPPIPRPIKQESLKQMIKEFLVQQNAHEIVVLEYAATKDKYANVFADGLFRKRIYFSDYFMQRLSYEEIKAVLLHEINHLKNFHTFVQIITFLLPWPMLLFAGKITYLIGFAIENMGFDLTSTGKNVISGVIVILVFIYIGFLWPYLLRLHERQADEYAIRSGITPEVLISALTKVTALNDQPPSLGKLEEKLSTHPSLENRIKYINEFAKSMVK